MYGQIGLSFALLSAGVLLGDYFVQFSVVPVSLMNGQTEGIALLTQYNPYGAFIVLEELGYLLMGLSFAFLAPVFAAGAAWRRRSGGSSWGASSLTVSSWRRSRPPMGWRGWTASRSRR